MCEVSGGREEHLPVRGSGFDFVSTEVALNIFAQVAFDELFDLAVGESLVQLYHNPRPPFGLGLWLIKSSVINLKSIKTGSRLFRK